MKFVMPFKKLVRACGLLAIIAGVLRIVEALLAEDFVLPILLEGIYFITDVCIMFALIGIFLYNNKTGLLGVSGFVLLILGASILIGPSESKDGVNYHFMGIQVFSVGVVFFSIHLWFVSIISKWVPFLWITSIIVGLTGILIPQVLFVTFLISEILFGIGLIVVGTQINFDRIYH